MNIDPSTQETFGTRASGEAGASQPNAREPRVRSVAKAISILSAVAQSSQGLRAGEIALAVELPRQATYHLIHTLVTLGMLTKHADSRYVLGLRVGSLVEAFPRHLAPPERLMPLLRQITNETGETSFASGWQDGEIVGLAVIRGFETDRVAEFTSGQHTDAHAKASGQLLLALADPVVRQRYLDHHTLNRRTAHTLTDPARFLEELEQIRRVGYVIEREQLIEGVSCLAMPVAEGTVPYAIGLAAPSDRFERSLERYLGIVRRIALASSAH